MDKDDSPASLRWMKGRKDGLWRWWCISGAILLLAAYSLTGFFAAPRFIRQAMLTGLNERFDGTVEVGAVHFNPFTFAVVVDGFEAAGAGGDWTLRVRQLRLRFSPWTVVGEEIRLHSLVLDYPKLEWAMPDDRTAPPGAASGGIGPGPGAVAEVAAKTPPPTMELPDFSIGRFVIEEGAVNVLLNHGGVPFERTVERLSFSIQDFRSDASGRNRYAFSATTATGETVSVSGALQASPPGASGEVHMSGIKLQDYAGWIAGDLNFEVVHGILDLGFAYRFEPLDPASGVGLSDGFLKIRTLVLRPANEDAPFQTIESLDLSGVDFDLTKRSMRIGALTARGGQHLLSRNAAGDLNWARYFRPRGEGGFFAAFGGSGLHPLAAAAGAQLFGNFPEGWDFGIGRIDISGQTLHWNDAFPDRPVSLVVEELAIQASGFDNGVDRSTDFGLTARLGQRGLMELSGTYQPGAGRVETQLGFDRIPASSFAPYFMEDGEVVFAEGTASGRLEVSGTCPGRNWACEGITGELRLSGIRARQAGDNQPAFSWDLLFLKGLRWTPGAGGAFSTGPVLLQSPQCAIAIGDGGWVVPAWLSGAVARMKSLDAVIESLELTDARVEIADGRSGDGVMISAGLSGTVMPLDFSGAEDSRFDLLADLAGGADGTVRIRGATHLPEPFEQTDFDMTLRDIPLGLFEPFLANLSPGRPVTAGRLSAEMDATIAAGRLSGSNRLVLEGLQFADPAGPVDKADESMALAVALLRDRSGVVRMDLPVAADMASPAGALPVALREAVASTLADIGSDPLGALALAVPGSPSKLPEAVLFEPGSAEIDDRYDGGLEALALALADRPFVRLELIPSIGGESDAASLEEQKWGRMLVSAVRSAGDEEAAIRELYRAAFPEDKSPSGRARPFLLFFWLKAPEPAEPKPEKTLEEMRAAVRATVRVTPDDLSELSNARLSALRNRILDSGAVEPGRVVALPGSAAAVDVAAVRIAVRGIGR